MKKLRIPNSLDIDKLLDRVPAEFEGFKKDKVYFVCDAIYKSSLRLDKQTHLHPMKKEKYYTPLHSDILSHYLGTAYYTSIIKWMEAAGIIEVDGSFQNKIVSIGYRFTKEYRLDQSRRIDVSDFVMYTKRKYKRKDSISVFKTSRTVTKLKKWYDGLTIDKHAAIDVIANQQTNGLCNVNSARKWEQVISQYNNSHAVLDMFEDDMADHHFQDETGRRLHTVLTSLPKYLRKHVRYKGKELAQTDLANSQLFFTLFLFDAKNWTKSRANKTKQLWEGLEFVPSSSYSIKCSETSVMQASKDIQANRFMQLVSSGQIYAHFVARMDKQDEFFIPEHTYEQKRRRIKSLLIAQINGDSSVINGVPKLYNFKAIGLIPTQQRRTYKKELKNLRLYTGKNLLLWKAFCEDFPAVVEMYDRIKRHSNADLSRVLQRIESTAVLEFACQEIAQKLPYVPLFTLHDCLVTTTEHIAQVDAIFKSAIASYIGVLPKTEIKNWSEYQEIAPIFFEDD